jgi:hypothetical protein
VEIHWDFAGNSVYLWRLRASQPAGKPNSVPRLRRPPSLDGSRLQRGDNHSSRPVIAHRLQRPTRWPRTGRSIDASARRRTFVFRRGTRQRHPIWSCSVRGFACHRRYRRRGALLPHLFTLTSPKRRARKPGAKAGGIFSVPLIRQVALPGRYPAPCPAEFGLSSRLRPSDFGEAGSSPVPLRPGCESRRSSGRLRRDDYRTPGDRERCGAVHGSTVNEEP